MYSMVSLSEEELMLIDGGIQWGELFDGILNVGGGITVVVGTEGFGLALGYGMCARGGYQIGHSLVTE